MTYLLLGLFLFAAAIALLLWYCAWTSQMVADGLSDEAHMDTEGRADE
ncbi:hypothetical protein FNL37_1793 [Methylovorus glucosotrophus]|nr:hypothetical protein [Methylovorus glucosotrophus]KAF0844349.1 hypothetical protein FNL37_1793 [Methylovorus glucosotrophus]